MSEHSPEPWHIDDLGYIVSSAGDLVFDELATSNALDADLRRIVACVNFCAVLDTEYLEGHRLVKGHDGMTLADIPGCEGVHLSHPVVMKFDGIPVVRKDAT